MRVAVQRQTTNRPRQANNAVTAMRNMDADSRALGVLYAGKAGVGSLPERGAVAERLLLREFSHRINNELMSAISLISVAAHRCNGEEARAALTSVLDRLENYASVQHSLQMPEYSTTIELTTYIHQLCRAVSRSKLEREGIELSLSLYSLKMRSDHCWLLGMIVFELITNSARHAFRDGPGAIHVEVVPTEESVQCRVTDNGKSDQNPRPGRGLAIVEALAASLQGTVDVQFGPNGTATVVTVPHQS
jgi:two-component sensor histidine kinase